jgi:two-component system, NarL family, sensor kinase
MNDFHNYINEFFSANNPLIYSVIFSLIIIVAVLALFFRVIYPMRIKFIQEKQKILLEQARLMALFSELDPDPLLRINDNGIITNTNEAARIIFPGIRNNATHILEVLKGVNSNPFSYIAENKDISFVENVGKKIFIVEIKGNSVYGFANIYLHDITTIKEYESQLEDYKNKLKTLAGRLESKFEGERKMISSELHDDIGQRLLLLKLRLGQRDMDPTHSEIYGDIEKAYSRVRELSRLMKPAEIDDMGLIFAIQSLVAKVKLDSGLTGDFTFLGKEERLDPELEICIYRIIQESLSNIIKHSGADEFSIQLMFYFDKIDLLISDNGKGIPEEYFESKDLRNFGIGLFNMKERVENQEGIFKIDSSPGEGTVLIIKLPKKTVYNEHNQIAGS